jgi:23S rRNA pseudouridine2457 synthase
MPAMLIAFHKPFGVISQFTPDGSGHRPLAEFHFPPSVYPIGRLDAESEGLLLLSDEPELNQRLLHPRHGHPRQYWAEVERVPAASSLEVLRKGIIIQGRKTLPCHAWILTPQPDLPAREPPIRFRKSVETCWVGLELVEGRNRQVRRMTAAIGHATLRLIRVRIGNLDLGIGGRRTGTGALLTRKNATVFMHDRALARFAGSFSSFAFEQFSRK